MQKKSPVVHFEMPAGDMGRMKKFYESVFGWKMNQLGPEMGNYVTVATSETDEQGMIQEPGRINGGFYEKSADPLSQYPSIVIATDNLEESIEKVKAAGGRTHGDIQPIPGVGRFVSIIDTEGNRISVLESLMK